MMHHTACLSYVSAVAVMGFLMLPAAACSKNSDGGLPTGPTSATPAIDPSCTDPTSTGTCPVANSIGVIFRVTALDGAQPTPFSYSVAGVTITGNGRADTAILGLTPGDYEVTGQVQQQIIFTVIKRASNASGGFDPSSIRHLEGPLQQQTPCSGAAGFITYSVPAGGQTPQTFRFKFTIGSGNVPFC
jgi:hypothetical protein